MEPRLKALIVDDEYPARQELRGLLRNFPEVEVVGEATNAFEALQLIKSLPYSVLFVDVSIPGTSGIDLAREIQTLASPPWIVFTTAEQEHALDAFAVNAVDYLLKPLNEEKLSRALTKISFLNKRNRAALEILLNKRLAQGGSRPTKNNRGGFQTVLTRSHREADAPLGRIPLHKADKTILVDESEVYYANSDSGYVYIKLENEKLLSRYTLKELEGRLGHKDFFRAHRCYLVNLRRVKELIPDFKGAFELVVNDPEETRIPVSRRRARQLRQLLGM